MMKGIGRGRFTVPIADLSAFGGCSAIQVKKVKSIIAPCLAIPIQH